MANPEVAERIWQQYQACGLGGIKDVELFLVSKSYEQMAEQRNNVKVQPIEYDGTNVGLALVASQNITSDEEMFIDYGIMYGRFQKDPRTKELTQKLQRLRLMRDPSIIARLSESRVFRLNELD